MREVRTVDDLPRRVHDARLQVAIDGPAGAGKTTVGCGLASILEIPVFDTGLMYRAVTKKALEIEDRNETVVAAVVAAERIRFQLAGSGRTTQLLADGTPLTEADLHVPEVDGSVPTVAANQRIREILVSAQRQLADGGPIIMLGRDIGTVVLPNAQVKLYLTADETVRAYRRSLDRNNEPNVLAQIQQRDRSDSGRPISPLAKADDAHVLDTSELSIEASVVRALQYVQVALESSVTDS